MSPKCPACKTDLSSGFNIGYEHKDVSSSIPELRFIDIFCCKKCGTVLNISNVS